MKAHSKAPNYTGEERVHPDGGSFLKKLSKIVVKPTVFDSDAVSMAKKALASEAQSEINAFANQLFGVELTAGKPVRLSKKADEFAKLQDSKEQSNKPQMTSEHMQYFAEFRRATEGKQADDTTLTIKHQLDSILAELRNLKNSSDELENVFKDVVVDEVPEKPGVYHLTFYEGFLKLVMKMRDRVEDGVVFAKLFKSRKGEKSYNAMAKKRGTSFTQHHDRAVATQTG